MNAIIIYIACLLVCVYVIALTMEYTKKVVYKDKAKKWFIWLTATVYTAIAVAFIVVSRIAQYPLHSLLGAYRWVDVAIVYATLLLAQYKANMTSVKKGVKKLVVIMLKGYGLSDDTIRTVRDALGIKEDA